MRALKWLLSIAVLTLLYTPLAQSQSPAVQEQRPGNPIYKITINVVERSTTAVNFRHRGGPTRLDFRGTPLLPNAHGEAEVETRRGYVDVKTEIKDMSAASRFGPEYLTYVLWAITPEGRAVNLGEVILDDDRGVLNVSTELQTFGLIVTAEPYFGVTQPSNVVVVESFVRRDTKGEVQQIQAKFELLERGQYTVNVPPSELQPLPLVHKPLDLYQAENAVRIARWAGAAEDAPDSFAKAESLLQQAQQHELRDPGSKPVSTAARAAVQAAEDARLIALRRQEEARLAGERAAAAEREAEAAELQRQAEEQQRLAQEQQRLEAERRRTAEVERAAAEAEAKRRRLEAEAAAAQAERDRRAAQLEIERANEAVEKAKDEQTKLRQQLAEQLNRVLETRDTARGLIVNMSDVLFDVGKWTLKPGAREKLAKVSGIVLSHPGLKLEVEGHTDSTGSDEFNQTLSERRANAVRDFLVEQGVAPASIAARGFGEARPITSNDTSAGRQLNRRVELIVTGEIIGTPLGPTTSLQ
jgi:outer membrane protein OmpA-like peptidoglycan-associated protein